MNDAAEAVTPEGDRADEAAAEIQSRRDQKLNPTSRPVPPVSPAREAVYRFLRAVRGVR